jgi:dihydropteroate synthase
MTGPLVRVVEAGLGPEAQVRLVVSGISDPDRLQRAWASSGAVLERVGERIHATTTVQALARAAGRALPTDEAMHLDRVLGRSVAAWQAPSTDVPLPAGAAAPALWTSLRPLVMGVVNVTPDSFADGGLLYPDGHPDRAVAHAQELVAQGADILDVGGESTRPGAEPVEVAEELARVLPVLEALRDVPVPCSIDTRKAEVARAATAAGAAIVNDVSGGADPDLIAAVAESGAAYVLMHTRGTPADMQQHATYQDVLAEVYEFLADGLERCVAAGIDRARILVDPGLGFAKTAEHNLVLLRGIRQLRGLGHPVVVGASRKSFLGTLMDGAAPDDRLEGSLACAALAVAGGVSVLRVHDVRQTVRLARVAHAVGTGLQQWPQPEWFEA